MPDRKNDAPEGRGGSGAGRQSKVGRLIEAHDLDGWSERLARQWTDERVSLRDLADQFNRRVLRAVMMDAGLNPTNSEVASTYSLLTDDEVSSGEAIRVEKRLRRAGIDVDELGRDFVSHQAIHTYLTKHRGVSLPENDSETQVQKTIETIQRLKSRVQAVAESSLENLVNTDRLTLGSFSVLVDIRVYCSDCGEQYELTELLTEGGCQC